MNPKTMAALAAEAMQKQLDVTPKPGLVDKNGTGAHVDLDYATMQKVIAMLVPHWETFAETGLFLAEKSDAEVSAVMEKVGEAVIDEIFAVTDGVNVYKGTVFCLGLFITAYYRLYRKGAPLTPETISDQIARLAAPIRRRKDTHGDWVKESYQVGGALAEAQAGYRRWLNALPLLREAVAKGEEARFFLYVVAHLEDSCLYYRAGAELAGNAATIAAYLYEHYNEEDVLAACAYFERCHLSTGGAGDILTLMLLADAVLR